MEIFNLVKLANNTIKISGTVDINVALDVLHTGQKILGNTGSIIIDLTDIDHFDTSLLSVLLHWRRGCVNNNQSMWLRSNNHSIQSFVQSLDLNKLLMFCD